MAELPAEATTKTCALRKRCCVSGRPPKAHSRLLVLLLPWLRRAALRRGVLARGAALTPQSCGGYIAFSNMLRAFALSSAASSVRKPPDSERCTICRSGWGGQNEGHVNTHARRRRHRPKSQGRARAAASVYSEAALELPRPLLGGLSPGRTKPSLVASRRCRRYV